MSPKFWLFEYFGFIWEKAQVFMPDSVGYINIAVFEPDDFDALRRKNGFGRIPAHFAVSTFFMLILTHPTEGRKWEDHRSSLPHCLHLIVQLR